MRDIKNIQKNIIMSFLIVISMIIGLNNVSAYAFSLPDEVSYESTRTLWSDSWSATLGNDEFNQFCFYTGTNDNSIGKVYCLYSSWTPLLSTNSRFINDNNPNGYYFYRIYRYSNSGNSYKPNYIMSYDGNSWRIECGTGITSWCNTNYTLYDNTFITYYARYNFANNDDARHTLAPVDSNFNYIADYGSIYYFGGFNGKPTISSGLAQDSQDRTIRYVRIYYDDYYDNKENYVFQYHLSDEASDFWHYKYADDLRYDESTGHYYYEFKIYMSTNIVARVLDKSKDIIGIEELVGSVSDIYSVTDLSYLDGYTKYEIPVGFDTAYISGLSGLGYIYVYEHANYVYSLYEYAPGSNKFYSYLQDTYEYDGILHKWQYSLDTAMQMNDESNIIVYFNRDYTEDTMIIYVPNGAYVSFSRYEKQSDYIFTDDFSYKDENGSVQNGSRTLYLDPEDIINNFSIHSGIQILDASLTSIIKPMYAKFPIIAQLLELKDIYSYNEGLQTPPEFRIRLDFRPFGFNLNVDEKVIDFRFYEDNRETIFFFIKVGVTIITILKLISYFDNSKVGVA